MASTYKTPGVYVEEVSTFPPSVAPVETAIPAFIGYTEKAIKNGESILNVPTKIGSFVEFSQYFGGAPDRNVVIRLNSSNEFLKAETLSNSYNLYYSLRLFYDNGGGDCYIVSVGNFSSSVSLGDDTSGIQGGLKALEKYDEPTLIVSPDAVLLSGLGNYDYQKKALAQCAYLQDRFLIGDLLKSDETSPTATFAQRTQEYRDNIGINDLKYGAAYTPFLKTTISANLIYRNVRFAKEGVPITNAVFDDNATYDISRLTLFGLTSDTAIRQLINDVENASKGSSSLLNSLTSLGGSAGLESTLKILLDDLDVQLSAFDENAAVPSSWADVAAELQALFDKIFEIIHNVKTAYDNLPDPSTPATDDYKLMTDVDALLVDLKDTFDIICTHYEQTFAASTADVDPINIFDINPPIFTDAIDFFYPGDLLPSNADQDATVAADYVTAQGLPEPIKEQLTLARNAANAAIQPIVSFFSDILNGAKTYETTFNNSLKDVFGTYKTLLNRAEQDLMVLPPSAAIAGIYTKVDNDRGVWKAPANVSLSSVSGPYVVLNAKDQEGLNVDVNAGKSINAIRSFTGKGVLVWGARTLAGNDNEWRYVPVRRFFNMVEESVKKATEQFVFEPNDANTWVRIRAMIENFLTLQWRAGALAGAKPDHAFFVKVGLGETMTADDILEGRMIVEIGMAVVRPAEFIILRFSHKMQES